MRIAAILAVACVACAAAGTPTTRAEPALPADPCALFTVQEVEEAIQSRVLRMGLVPKERVMTPEDSPPCEYITAGRHASITVRVSPGTLDGFADLQRRDPANADIVGAVGDESYAHSLATLFVRVGKGYFVLDTQQGAGRAGVEDLKRLAVAALD